MNFGYTNDPLPFEEISAWRAAAIADGWTERASYQTESIERAATLERAGFKVQVILRMPAGTWKYEAKLSVWGPDGLVCMPPRIYDWAVIVARMKHCNYCESDDVETRRVGFAGRCCSTCMPSVRGRVERPGWSN